MITVNAMGDNCPIPVIKTKKAMEALTGPETIEVLVDNEIAVQNVTKMAASAGGKVTSEKKAEKEYVVTIEMEGAMAADVEAARQLVYHAAVLKDNNQDATKACSIAKYFAAEAANRCAYKAVQIHGGYGYIKEYKVERLYRDARICTIYEGTSQVQQMVISGQLLRD